MFKSKRVQDIFITTNIRIVCFLRLSELVTDLEEILMNRVDVELISDLFEDINLMADVWPRLRDGNTTGMYHISRNKTNKMSVRPAKTQISPGIRRLRCPPEETLGP